MVYNKKLKRRIPEGWCVDNILRVGDLLGGGTPRKNELSYWGGDIPFFTPTDAECTPFKINTLDYITEEGLKHCSSSLFDKGTIFITARGSVGNVMIVARSMAMNQSCYALKPLDKINYGYLYCSAINLVHYLKVKSSGSVFNSIVSNDIRFTPMVIPPVDIIENFGVATIPTLERILTNTRENQHLASLRDWLLPMLMNGQASVN